jgi:hypothetical protein
MALRPTRLALVFGMILAMMVIIRAITTGPAPPESESTAPIPSKETIYRPQLRNVF